MNNFVLILSDTNDDIIARMIELPPSVRLENALDTANGLLDDDEVALAIIGPINMQEELPAAATDEGAFYFDKNCDA